jgi:hypothetical protein
MVILHPAHKACSHHGSGLIWRDFLEGIIKETYNLRLDHRIRHSLYPFHPSSVFDLDKRK